MRPRDRDLHGLARKTDGISILNDFYCTWLLIHQNPALGVPVWCPEMKVKCSREGSACIRHFEGQGGKVSIPV